MLTKQSNNSSNVTVPVRSLGENHRVKMLEHLLSLDGRDRHLRFGFAAKDEQIGRYVDSLDFSNDELFGVFNRHLRLIAVAHLAYSRLSASPSNAEFGVSVLPYARQRGYGTRLFERAVMHARNAGVSTLLVSALTENTAMLKIASRAGALVERQGPEARAVLRLPPANFCSRWTEIWQEHAALQNYHFKVHVLQVWQSWLSIQKLWWPVLSIGGRNETPVD